MSKSLAIAYGMKKKMTKGGQLTKSGYESSCDAHCTQPCEVHEKAEYDPKQEPIPKHNEAAMEETNRKLGEHGEREEGREGDEGHYTEGGQITDNEQDSTHEMDMVDRIMKQRQMEYSKGGMVANEAKSNRGTDYLATDDDLEFNYTGANSGDELSSPGEDERRKDIVSRVMASRKKKDKLPNPR